MRLLPVLVACLVLSLPLFPQEDPVLCLRVRETGSGSSLPERKREDFRITINGRPAEILALKKRSMSLARKPDLGRIFVLSFRMSRMDSSVEEALEYLASEIFDIRDTLFVRTPLTLHRMGVLPNKETTLRRIRELVNADGPVYGKERASIERRLDDDLMEVRGALGSNPESPETYKRTSLFLNVFPGQYTSYQERFLLPDPSYYRSVMDQIPFGENERWWIHFEQHEASKLFLRIQRVLSSIKSYIQGLTIGHQKLGQVLGTKLAEIEKRIRLPEVFPAKRLAEELLAHDLNYSVIFFRDPKGAERDFAQTPYPNLEALYEQVTDACGGLAVSFSAGSPNFNVLAGHVDEFYELALDGPAEIEAKTVQVELSGTDRHLSYVSRLDEDEIRSRMEYLSREKIRIGEFAVKGKRLSFEVRSFALKEDESFGLLRIRVQLYDLGGGEVYHQENTVRATRDRVSFSLPLSEHLEGQFRVVITACDLIANRRTETEHPVELRNPASLG